MIDAVRSNFPSCNSCTFHRCQVVPQSTLSQNSLEAYLQAAGTCIDRAGVLDCRRPSGQTPLLEQPGSWMAVCLARGRSRQCIRIDSTVCLVTSWRLGLYNCVSNECLRHRGARRIRHLSQVGRRLSKVRLLLNLTPIGFSAVFEKDVGESGLSVAMPCDKMTTSSSVNSTTIISCSGVGRSANQIPYSQAASVSVHCPFI